MADWRDTHKTLADALDLSFADQARLHDALLSEACIAFEGERHAPTAVEGLRLSRLADCVKAMMFASEPDAARVWHGVYSLR